MPAPEQEVCQDRIQQKYVVPYSYESKSGIKLVAFKGNDDSFVPRKDMRFRSILLAIKVGVKRDKTDFMILD